MKQKDIKKLTKEQKIIFLDITADWCITCKYNEITVLKNAKLLRFLSDNLLIASFTNSFIKSLGFEL